MSQLLRKSPILCLTILIAVFSFTLFLNPSHASAAKHKTDPGYQKIFDEQICPALMQIHGQRLGGYCKDYAYQEDLDNAYHKICNKYGHSQLKDECKAYHDYQPGSFTPSAGGSTGPGSYSLGDTTGPHHCGGGDNQIDTSINIGCAGKGNAILDLAFAIIRFLSNGAGLVIIASLVWGGLQYIFSRGDPQSTAAAVGRMRSAVVALFIFIFAYAIINYLIPGQVLQ